MSLFNRPAWATSSASKPSESQGNIFSHSAKSYQEIVADRARQRQKEKVKEEKKQKNGKERDQRGTREGSNEAGGSLKKRRITFEDADAILKSAGLGPFIVPDDESEDHGVDVNDGDFECKVDCSDSDVTLRRTSPRLDPHLARGMEKSGSPQRSTRRPEGSDERQYHESQDHDAKPSPSYSVGLVEDESDDEFAELSRRARQRHKEQTMKTSVSSGVDDTNIRLTSADLDNHEHEPPDPVIQIFVSSPIPDTKPLIVQRKLSQRIQEIREAWCNRQNFSKEFAKGVFFIHSMHRVYDVTTCRSLGLEVDVFGNVTLRGAEGKTGVDKIHLEAVTEEIYKQMKEEREQEALRRSGQAHEDEQCGDNNDNSNDGEKEARPVKGEQVRLVLKAKGREDFKIIVKPNAVFSRIMAAYCKTMAPGKTISLQFDGERLDPDIDVQSSEVTDMDCLDVYFED